MSRIGPKTPAYLTLNTAPIASDTAPPTNPPSTTPPDALPKNDTQLLQQLEAEKKVLVEKVRELESKLQLTLVHEDIASHTQLANKEDMPALLKKLKRLMQKFTDYRINESLGEGGFGVVVRCTLADGTCCAVKTIVPDLNDPYNRNLSPKELKAKLSSEALIMKKHSPKCPYLMPYLHHIYEESDTKPKALIFLPFFPYPATLLHLLEAKIGTCKRLFQAAKDPTTVRPPFVPQEELVHLFLQLSRGLEYLHANQIIHRDLKPDNIFIVKETSRSGNRNTRLYIGDFGVSRVAKKAMTEVGTPRYMAPEVHTVTVDGYTSSADIWSFGIVLFEFLTLWHAYGDIDISRNNFEMLAALRKGQHPNYPPYFTDKYKAEYAKIVAIVQFCLTVTPQHRPTAKLLVKNFEGLAREMQQ